jgi:hypothetical protein
MVVKATTAVLGLQMTDAPATFLIQLEAEAWANHIYTAVWKEVREVKAEWKHRTYTILEHRRRKKKKKTL